MKNSVVVLKKQIQEILKTPSTKGVRLVEPFKSFALKNKLPFKILEDNNIVNAPEIHAKEGDLWYCLEGECTFKHGGKLIKTEYRKNDQGNDDKNELVGHKIKGGQKCILRPGDWLWIPPHVPHQHLTKTIARLLIIKIPINQP